VRQALYGNILVESAYESPESLVKYMTVIEEDKGYHHRYNVRALIILQARVRVPKLIFTVADIAEYTGLSKHTTSECIRRWMKYDFRYLTRLPKRIKDGAYKYKIRKHSLETYMSLKKRIRRNLDLTAIYL
jgi:hypothetical protein